MSFVNEHSSPDPAATNEGVGLVCCHLWTTGLAASVNGEDTTRLPPPPGGESRPIAAGSLPFPKMGKLV